MQIILLESIPHVGQLGDVVKVKDGFARNYLIPRSPRQWGPKRRPFGA